ncbi:hypothetical protein E1A91_D03G020600v1 [Gossypium mustelinum]|uniref:TF-B3 domain-containing protein n=1 Tax=Gossypium mustelinum TaxID=34275 RepID=A0A5D2VHU7_GOSMU|nr:hypothetical protein E1A91_D03G020600v1 [Gossypium mustelinum]
MTRKPKRNPSFFKILIGNFDKKLRIPPAFVKYIFKGNVPTMLTLYSDSGNSWRVRIKVEQAQGSYFFNNGWSKFVKYRDLEIGDFLVFFLVDSSTFDVFIYNRTACAKIIILAAKKRKGRSPRVSRQIEQTPSHKCTSTSKKPRTVPRAQEVEFVSGVTPKSVSYVMVVKGYNKYYAGIPRSFTEEAGLGKVSMVMIKGPSGMWPMMTTFSSKQVLLSVGWSKFLHENEIVIGDTLLFEHVPNTGHLIHVQVVNKDGTGNCGSLAGKRPRDRPREQTELPPSTKYASSSKRTKGVSELILEQASFVVVLKKYHQYSVVRTIKFFAKETSLAEEPSKVIKDSEGRKWELNILVDAKSNVRLGAGWSQFVLENRLEAGDTISFQHMPHTGNVIHFKIISKARAANMVMEETREKMPVKK